MSAELRAHLQTTLGSAYVLGRELGGGGMSRVFIAEEAGLRRRIVVKLLPREMAADVSIARFQREIAVAAQLQHPHIVPLLATGETDGLPYYTMPFVEGETLRDRLARVGELPVMEAVRLLREIATALDYAHEHGVVHRDIKPENVLLSGGIALVTDFGVAKAILASATTGSGPLTSVGMAVGTPAYMSPEQISADPGVDQRTDLYALGMIAYEMLAGQSPFAGRTAQQLLAAHVVNVPEPLQTRRPAVPPALAALVMRCIEKRPADRPQSAGEIVRTLDAITTPTHASALSSVMSRRRSRATLVMLVLVVIAITGGLWFKSARRTVGRPEASRRLLIAPFENLTGDARFDHVGRLAADRIALDIAQRGSMDVVPSNLVLMALRDTTGGQAERLRRFSEATNAGLIVSGTVVMRGDSLTLQAQVTDVRTGKVVLTLDPAVASTADPMAAVYVLEDRLLGALGNPGTAILPRGFRAPKYAAYQQFAAGFERFAVRGDNMGSRPFFERAIAIDSNYTRAYLLLGRQYIDAGEYDRADSMARRIEQLPLGLSESERLQLDYMKATLQGDRARMLTVQQQLVARDSNTLSLHLAGQAANAVLKPKVAIPALEQADAAFILLGGIAATLQASGLAEAYHQSGAHDRELRTLVARRGIYPDLDHPRGMQLRAYAGLAQSSAAMALADSMVRSSSDANGSVLRSLAVGAEEFRVHGDKASAAQLYAKAQAWSRAHPTRTLTRDRALAEGVVMLAAGMPDSAAQRFASVATDSSQIAAAGYLALAQLARGDRGRARTVADSLGALRRPWLFGRHTFWRAAIMGALGERDLAVELLRQAHREGQRMDDWHFTIALDALRGHPAFQELIRPQR